DNVYAEFTATGNSLTGGYVYSNGLDSIPFDQMRATWDLYGGADPLTEVDPVRLVLKFAAADRADIYYPRGNTSQPARAIMTRRHYQLDPLQVWWMREVNTAIVRDNIPADGITRTPDFTWVIDNQPRPILQNGDPVLPLYQYEIWNTAVSANVDDHRDGPYGSPVASGWIPDRFRIPTGLTEKTWYLFVVMAVDESGNAEQWPANLPIDGSNQINIEQNITSDSNWRRFYYPAIESEIDTRVTAEFWHDVNSNGFIDDPEPYFGNQTIIPMPATTPPTVNALFTGEVISSLVVDTEIDWTLYENGVQIGTGTGPTFPWPNLGDPSRLRPYNYVLTAQGRTDAGAPFIVDPTPVNIRFTVVPETNITEYLKNSQTDDAQPFKDFDRE
ncbi:MAG: hypothetical protein VCD00_00095, partial [Candidatus Hydrogenedentota bacterium]